MAQTIDNISMQNGPPQQPHATNRAEQVQEIANHNPKKSLGMDGYRTELEEIVKEALSLGTQNAASMAVLQQVSELIAPLTTAGRQQLPAGGFDPLRSMRFGAPDNYESGSTRLIIPVNDMRSNDGIHYTKEERQMRCKLAALYRLIDLLGWSQGIYNHITVRLAQELEHFLINPFGLMYSEITASSLLTVDMQGNVLSPGSTNFGMNQAGYTLHSAIHAFRPDIKCIIHCHTKTAAAVSAMKCGLLPISQEALIVGNVSYYEYAGILTNENEKDRLAKSLGVHNKVMLLRNHGFVACGATIEEAFHVAYNLMKACDIQINAMAAGGAKELIQVGEDIQNQTHKVASDGGGGGVNTAANKRQWNIGELEFEGWMRKLDYMGYRTNYPYKESLNNNKSADVADGQQRQHHKDVEYPPTSSSRLARPEDASSDRRLQMLRELIEKRKEAERVRWIRAPDDNFAVLSAGIPPVRAEHPNTTTNATYTNTTTKSARGSNRDMSGERNAGMRNGMENSAPVIRSPSSTVQFSTTTVTTKEVRDIKRRE